MLLTELLTAERVLVLRDPDLDKPRCMTRISELLAQSTELDSAEVERVLVEREKLQSTGIGDGVAIPHAAAPTLGRQVAALIVVPDGLEFDALDGKSVHLVVGVIGPKRATGEHLKTLARISRLLRSADLRSQLIAAPTSEIAWGLLSNEERACQEAAR